MQKVTLSAIVTFGPDVVLGLTEEQAKLRAHLIVPDETEGTYRALSEVSFKAGEVVEVDMEDLPRALQIAMEPAPKKLTKAQQKALDEANK